jgi:4-azaleucine resistance transporter AzlC
LLELDTDCSLYHVSKRYGRLLNLLENSVLELIRKIQRRIKDGFNAAIPICFGYLPLGFACGVLAQKANLSLFEIAGMSTIVFAGSSQFIAVSMIAANSSIEAIVIATFIVNFRHFLMSSVLAKYLGNKGKIFLLIYSHGVTDESFAINYHKFTEGPWDAEKAIIVNIIAFTSWNFGNIIGGFSGVVFPISNEIASYTLTAMFIGLLVLNFKNKIFIIVGIVTGVVSIYLSLILKNSFYIVITAILGASLGYFIENKIVRE